MTPQDTEAELRDGLSKSGMAIDWLRLTEASPEEFNRYIDVLVRTAKRFAAAYTKQATDAARVDELENNVLNHAYYYDTHGTTYDLILALHVRKRLAELQSKAKDEI